MSFMISMDRGINHTRWLRIYIYTSCYTDWVQTLVTTISCRLGQSNGSLICPFAGGAIACVHTEVVGISITLR